MNQPVRLHRHRGRAVVLLAAATLIAAACGSDNNSGSSATAAPGTAAAGGAATTAAPATTAAASAGSTAGTTAGATATTAAAGGGETSVTDYIAYSGGKAGAADPSLSTIKVGYVNQEGGPIEIGPTNDDGAEIAVKYINEKAGGIGGHPVELVKCYIASTEEEGQQCGQQLANDSSIVAVLLGAVAVGAEPLYAALGDKPVVGGVSVNAVDINQPSAGVLYGGAQYILAPYATFARDTLHAKSAALIFSEGPGTELPAAGQASAFTTAGIPIKSVSYAADTPDLTAPLQAAGATTADVVMPVINPNDCVKFEQAIKQLNIPDEKVLASPICLTPSTIEGLGDFPKWIYAIASSQTFDTTDPAVPPYQQILKDQGQDKLIGDPWVNVGFGQMLTLAKWMNAAGPDNLTPDAIVA
ncbi:MAG TPA: ABC transporter substrate-binding protein, partial [Ilumatobacteraceae bacterium]|nr:ABC transporter substrate-binding protein [Ilumatobacteraceae bacterium]